jgi:CubicO group peptidase (beta-lactamase class C family)
VINLAISTSIILFSIAGNLSAQQLLSEGMVVKGTLSTTDTLVYQFDVGLDHFVLGELNQISVNVSARLSDPNGQVLGTGENPSRGSMILPFENMDEGRHTIEVFSQTGETGSFELSLKSVRPLATDPSALVNQLMAPYDRTDSPGAAVSVWKDGVNLFSKTYGMANLTYGIPFELDTPTNIGSTSKQFTAFAIMLLNDRGELSLDDDIRKHLPELPEFEHLITVRNLITHTSGLREFLNLFTMAGRQLDNGDHIDRKELITIVQRQPALQNPPNTEWNYNNTAFGLAAVIVERISEMPFHEFMRDNVFEPLGMTHSQVRPSAEHIVPKRSVGYILGADGFEEKKDLGGAVGAGGIYASVVDLQRWAENYRNPVVGNAKIFEEMMTSFVLDDGEKTDYGYGLMIEEQRGLRRIEHGGADVAHRSQLVLYPEINAGLTVQSNHANFDSSIAYRLGAAFFGEHMDPENSEESDFDPDSYDLENFDELAGKYALDAVPSFVLDFTRSGDSLFTQATDQIKLQIIPTSDLTFRLTRVEASVEFHRNEDGTVDSVTLDQAGRLQRATRISAVDEPESIDPNDFQGTYFSEEIETFYRVRVEDGSLILNQLRLGDMELRLTIKDTYSEVSGLTVSFERDRNDQVVGFYLANGRTRNVRFEKVQ